MTNISPKVSLPTAIGALVTLIVLGLGAFGVNVPAEGATALTTLLMALAAYAKVDPLRDIEPNLYQDLDGVQDTEDNLTSA